jgi:hypothetical protein
VNEATHQWLLAEGGPAIRYRTATELFAERGQCDLTALQNTLLTSATVGWWLAHLKPGMSPSQLHGSRPTCFENAAAKLTLLGCHAGMVPLDERMASTRQWLAARSTSPPDWDDLDYYRMLVAARLAAIGYDDEGLRHVIRQRVSVLGAWARQGRYDIYVEQDTYGSFPEAFRRRSLVDPAIYPKGVSRLPSIHDLYALTASPWLLTDAEAATDVDAVIGYILHPDYQHLEAGYGIMVTPGRRYRSIGWDIKLPGYDGWKEMGTKARQLVQRLMLMAHFPVAQRHPWFRAGMDHLQRWATKEGTYHFPGDYLWESKSGYWVNGSAMGLEENRRRRRAIEMESTFWMAKLAALCTRPT